jgi:hypothetical protein
VEAWAEWAAWTSKGGSTAIIENEKARARSGLL